MTRSDRAGELLFDPEIEKTARSLQKEARLKKQASVGTTSTSREEQLEEMARERTLRELAATPVDQPTLCINYPELDVDFELRSGLIHLLPKFRGLENEDPHKHLKAFHVVCSSMKPQGVSEEQIKLRAFPFSLEDAAKDWLFYMPAGTITTWPNLVRLFLDKYFPTSRAIGIRKEICGIKQRGSENLHEYWERFKRLCASCPQHGIPEITLLQYFIKDCWTWRRR